MDRLEFARKIIKVAADISTKYFYSPSDYSIENKPDSSPVTNADLEIEQYLRQEINTNFPQDSILGEEFETITGTNNIKWLIDPIDGTKSFIHGVPLYSILIGIDCGGVNIGGVICLPALGELLWAGKNIGTWHESPHNKNPIKTNVSTCNNIKNATFLTSEITTYDKIKKRYCYEELEKQTQLTRTWGDAFGYFLVATGKADIMVDPIMSDWDAGPLMIILEEAGGKFTDWKGNRNSYKNEGVATNGILHNLTLEILNNNNNQ
jgi:histidinol phosphatase-like enzyme (inositol monophosphatase family)